jgi:hypothetical protein
MAVNNTGIDTNRTEPRKLMESINNGRTFISKLDEVKAEMDAMINGADFTVLEAYYGLQPGQGSPLWYLVSGAQTAFKGQAVLAQLLSWVTPLI